MRLDKLTTKFQQALADAQSLAIGHDNQMIEPQHLLLALLQQDDGGRRRCWRKPASNVQALKRRSIRRSTACRRSKATAARCRSAAT
jgi:ATP-dependent Clp protease ATP-binding subunit ClpB